MLTVVQAKGVGYSISREEELQTIKDVAVSTGEQAPFAQLDMQAHYCPLLFSFM